MEMVCQVRSSCFTDNLDSGQVLMVIESAAADGSWWVKGEWFQKNNYFLYESYGGCCQWRRWYSMSSLTRECCRVICRSSRLKRGILFLGRRVIGWISCQVWFATRWRDVLWNNYFFEIWNLLTSDGILSMRDAGHWQEMLDRRWWQAGGYESLVDTWLAGLVLPVQVWYHESRSFWESQWNLASTWSSTRCCRKEMFPDGDCYRRRSGLTKSKYEIGWRLRASPSPSQSEMERLPRWRCQLRRVIAIRSLEWFWKNNYFFIYNRNMKSHDMRSGLQVLEAHWNFSINITRCSRWWWWSV